MAAPSSVEDSNPTFPRQGVVPVSSAPPPPPPPPTSMGDDTSKARVGKNPTPPSNDQRITRTAAVAAHDGGHAPKSSVRGEVGLRDSSSSNGSAIVWAEALLRDKSWVLFVLGNLISAAVVISEMSLVDGCFDEPPEEKYEITDSRGGYAAETGTEPDTSEGSIQLLVMALLVFGLATELISAVVLSFVCRSPLDIKSMRKVPPDTIRSCGWASVIVNFLAPFSWGVIYTCGSYVTIQSDTFASCGGPDGYGLAMYLVVSGLSMFVVGLGLLGLSVFVFVSSCSSPARCTGKCCAAVRRAYTRRILSIAPLFDMFWQVQGVVWLYRTGGADAAGFVVLVVFCVVGGLLAVLGSRAPDSDSTQQELPGGSPRLVLTQQPGTADGA